DYLKKVMNFKLKTPNVGRRFILAATAISISTILTITVSEIMLHVAARIFPRVETVLWQSPMVGPILSDTELGFRGNPRFSEHDAKGFRNRGVPDTTDIVAIGDSHTYGKGVALDQAWPRVLEKLTLCRVYSMALGGYGPLQYAVLAEQA